MNSEAKEKLLDDQIDEGRSNWRPQLFLILGLCVTSCAALTAYLVFSEFYQQRLDIPPKLVDVPLWYFTRSHRLENSTNDKEANEKTRQKHLKDDEFPSKIGSDIINYKYSKDNAKKKLVCYYATPATIDEQNLYPKSIDPHLCTHINVGVVTLAEHGLYIDDRLRKIFNETKTLKRKNKNLKVLLWVGGADSTGFPQMVATHATRKIFIRSLRDALRLYHLDGVDLDWEFPSAHRKERQHFSQLLYEIRKEYQREHRDYLLTVAAAAPEGIVYFAYDIRELNKYVDFVNIMTYDYHFYSKSTPFTGLNAPLYARRNERSILATLNLNYTVKYWESQGLYRDKMVVGLPTFGHSFRLVNPFNNGIGSPAEDVGRVGTYGFASYSEVCWFKQRNIYVTTIYDAETCSPYLYAGTEWISYEDERSLECKAQYIKANGFGGAMIFSLNTDDYGSHCNLNSTEIPNDKNSTFPLVRKIYSVLFDRESDSNF